MSRLSRSCRMQKQLDRFAEAFTDLAYERVECIDCGDEVVSVIRASGTATSSIAGEVTYGQVETWHAGRVVSIRYFTSRADAIWNRRAKAGPRGR